jgi:hypothetical protein
MIRRIPTAFVIGLLAWIQPAQAALRLQVRFGEFERSVAVADFAQFADTGQAPPGLAWYLNRIKPADRAALRSKARAARVAAQAIRESMSPVPP